MRDSLTRNARRLPRSGKPQHNSTGDGVIGWNALAAPDSLRGPLFRWIAPKRIARRQTERQENRRAEVEAARGYIALADLKLMTTEADGKPTLRVECSGSLDHSADDGRQRGTQLLGRNILRKLPPQRHLRQQLKRAEAIRKRAADWRKGPLRADEPLLNGCVLLGTGGNCRQEGLPCGRLFAHGLKHVDQHGLDDEAVVIVPVKLSAIAVNAVAFLPFFMVAHSVIDAHRIPLYTRVTQGGLDHSAEKQPVTGTRLDHASRAQRLHQVRSCFGFKLLP